MMNRSDISSKLTEIFRSVLSSDSLELTDDLTANDVENWDSLTHMILISDIELAFHVKFRLKELNKVRNVGDLIDLLLQKL